MLTENGRYKLFAGSSSEDIRLETEIQVKGENIPLRDDSFEAQYFDSADGIKIFWLKNIGRYCIRVCEWTGVAVYEDVNFKDKKNLVITASSFMKDEVINADICGEKIQININVSDGFDDFSEYSVRLPENLPDSGKIVFFMPSDTELLNVKLS